MKKIAICIALVQAACAWGQSTPVDATATDSPKVIDGKTDDWTTGLLRYYDSNLRLSYDIANDRKNVYLVFQLDHELGTMQQLHSELQIDLEPGGKNKRKAGIAFGDIKPPKSGAPSLDSTRAPRNHEKGDVKLPAGFLKQAGLRFETDGFVSDNGTHTLSDTLPIRAAADMDEQGNLTYELVIPLSQLAADPATTSLLFSKKIDLGFSMMVHHAGNGGAAHQNNDDIPGTPSGMGSGMNGMGSMSGNMQGPPGGMNGGNMGGTGMGGGQPQGGGNFQGGQRSDDSPSESRESVKRKLQLKQL